jgi:AraC-like DNA-binding protein
VLTTHDPDEAKAEIGSVFCAHELEVVAPGARLDVVHNSARIGGVGLNYLRYGAQVRITPGRFGTFYLLQIPLRGTARVAVGGRAVASDPYHASLPSPTEPVDMTWSADCEQLMVYLDRASVDAYAGAGSATSIVFDPLVDLRSPMLGSWLRLVRFAWGELERGGGILADQVAAVAFEQALIAGLLAAQPHSSVPAIAPRGRLPHGTVQVALELLEAHPEHPWRAAELASRVGVSVRRLQEAFQHEHGVSPLGQLRRIRLARVRGDLLAAEPGNASVTAIATRWGFFHLGRFAQAYRVAYGEPPSATLAR